MRQSRVDFSSLRESEPRETWRYLETRSGAALITMEQAPSGSAGVRAGVRGYSRSEEPPESISTAPLRRPWWIGKPGSVVERHSSGMNVTTHLVRPTRRLGRVNPRRLRGAPAYLVLLPGGFAMPVLLPVRRWALTPPFHPYLIRLRGHRRFVLCCTFRRVTPPWCYQAQHPMEPGLSSGLAASDALIHPTTVARGAQHPALRGWAAASPSLPAGGLPGGSRPPGRDPRSRPSGPHPAAGPGRG